MHSTKYDILKVTAVATWVKGHQVDQVQYEELPFEARENIDMDKKCELMRTSNDSTPPTPYFFIEKVQVVIDGIPVTQQIREYLRITTAEKALQEYVCKKISWSKETFKMVNWTALEIYLKNIPGTK